MEDDYNIEEASVAALKNKISQFALPTPSPTPSPSASRRSARLQSTIATFSQKSSPSPSNTPTKKRKFAEASVDLSVVEKSPPKKKKGYSPPETYAHLEGLTDRLGYDLDGAF